MKVNVFRKMVHGLFMTPGMWECPFRRILKLPWCIQPPGRLNHCIKLLVILNLVPVSPLSLSFLAFAIAVNQTHTAFQDEPVQPYLLIKSVSWSLWMRAISFLHLLLVHC